MKILIIFGVVALVISALLLVVNLLLKIGIDTKCYINVLKTNTLFFPVDLPEDITKALLSKPLGLKEIRLLVRCRAPRNIEYYIMNLTEPLLIIGTMLLVGGYMRDFDSGLSFCLALLSSFWVPKIVSLLSLIVIWILEEIYWKPINRKYKKISE